MSDFTWSMLLYTVWDPRQVGLNQSLENIQKFAMRMCTKNWNQEYDVLLNSYGIPTLAGRRKQLKLCSLFQMMNGEISFHNTPPVRRPALNLRNSNPHLLVQPAVATLKCTSVFLLSPHYLTVQPTNKLCEMLHSFKHCIRFLY